jgi:hypothetical protein
LPVIVLVVVVIVLGLGGAYLVATGEDGAGRAADQEPTTSSTTAASSTTASTATTAPATATPNPATAVRVTPVDGGGLQVDWDGPDGPAYILRILSPAAPPRRLDAGPTTELLVPAAALNGETALCFDVAGVPPATAPPLDPAVPLPVACVGGATPESVRRA